jgi:hypothetical protein
VPDEEDVMVSSRAADPQQNGHPAPPAADRRIGPERIAELLTLADAVGLALQVLEGAARSAREDLDSLLRNVAAIDRQQRAGRGAAHALDEAGARAAQHLRTVDRLTEAASRTVGAALAESGSHASEAALEQLDAWADLSRIEAEGLHEYRRDRWGLADVLESLDDLHEVEARRLQQLIERRSDLLTSLTQLLARHADTARAVTDTAR